MQNISIMLTVIDELIGEGGDDQEDHEQFRREMLDSFRRSCESAESLATSAKELIDTLEFIETTPLGNALGVGGDERMG